VIIHALPAPFILGIFLSLCHAGKMKFLAHLALFTMSVTYHANPAGADPAVIEAAHARPSGASWTFSVTVRHADTGWEDYADGWRVLDGQGSVLGERVLFRPHVTEQPFTRSLSCVEVPNNASFVMLQTRTKPEEWGDALYRPEIAD
jgi:hypothetical protein